MKPPFLFLTLALLHSGCSIIQLAQYQTRPSDINSLRISDEQLLFYRAAGLEHGTTPIILVHGIPDASDSWNSIMLKLGRTHPVYAVDLAGYGYSERTDNYDISLSAQAGYLLRMIDKLGLEHVIFIGHDIGGGIAQIFATQNPHRVDRLVLINSVIDDNWPVPEMRMLGIKFISYPALAIMEEPMWKYVLRKGFFNKEKVTDDVLHRFQHWYQDSSGRHRLIRNASALNNADLTGIRNKIRALTVPTLILWGREDEYLAPDLAQELCKTLLACQFEFVEQAGHYVLDEQPAAIANAIQNFLLTRE
jgi:2-hydroxymuconate-semialdehyde hydrolase